MKASSLRALVIIPLLFTLFPLAAQQGSAGTTARSEPEPYVAQEFPPWLLDLRRAEIISLGALPFVTFMSSIYYDVYRYYDNGQDEGYLPWPMKKKDIAVPLSEREQKNLFMASLGISVSVAAIDYFWRFVTRSLKDRKAAADRETGPRPIVIEPILTEGGQ